MQSESKRIAWPCRARPRLPPTGKRSCRTAVLTHPEKRLDRHTRQSYRVNHEVLRIGAPPAVPCCLHVVGAGGLCRFGAVPTDTTSVNCAEYTNCLGQGGGGKIPG